MELEAAIPEVPPFSPFGEEADATASLRGHAPSAPSRLRGGVDLAEDLASAVGWTPPAARQGSGGGLSPSGALRASRVEELPVGDREEPVARESEVQAALLRAEGFTVRNTFIDSASAAPEGASGPGRSHSAPPYVQTVGEVRPNKGIDALPQSPIGSTATTYTTGVGLLLSGVSNASTAASESDWPAGGGCAGRDIAPDEVDHPGAEAARALVKIVADACGFLRIRGHDLLLHSKTKASQRLGDMTLKVHVHGLPLAKRDKWLLPLRRAVVTVLQKIGCAATIVRGEVYVTLDSGVLLRVDLCGVHT